jgi:hypothetical protein
MRVIVHPYQQADRPGSESAAWRDRGQSQNRPAANMPRLPLKSSTSSAFAMQRAGMPHTAQLPGRARC